MNYYWSMRVMTEFAPRILLTCFTNHIWHTIPCMPLQSHVLTHSAMHVMLQL